MDLRLDVDDVVAAAGVVGSLSSISMSLALKGRLSFAQRLRTNRSRLTPALQKCEKGKSLY